MSKNVYEDAKKRAEATEQDLSALDQQLSEVGIKAFKTMDLKDGDLVCMQATEKINTEHFRRIRIAMQATKETLGIDVKFLVIPHDFELKILRPTKEKRIN